VIGPILLALSWLFLRLEGRGLDAIGIDRPRRRVQEFAMGFAALGFAAALQQIGLSFSAGDPFVVNPAWNWPVVLEHLRFTINSVLFEELLFRGYLLYLAGAGQRCRAARNRRLAWRDLEHRSSGSRHGGGALVSSARRTGGSGQTVDS
jgi:hypothetical protein